MLKNGSLILLFFLSCLITLGQPAAIDSLERILKSSKNNTGRINILNELANKYEAYQPHQSKKYAERALSLSKELGYKQGEIRALNYLGENEFRQSNYAQAVEYTTQSLKLAEQEHDSTGMALAYRVLGNIYTFGFKQYDAALQYQLSALKIYERKNDKRNMAAFCGNITWIYASTNQNLKEAHRLANLGVHLADSLGDKQLLSYNYNSKGLIYLQEEKFDSALFYLDESIRMAGKVNDHAVIAYDNSIKGNVYLRQGDTKKAIAMFEFALIESKKINQRETQKDSYAGLAKGYEKLGNYPLAYRNHLLYIQLKDSLVNWETTQKALITRMRFAEEKREAKITELELANQLAHKEKVFDFVLFGAIFLSMVVVLILVVKNNRHRTETNLLLQEKNTEIAEQNLKLKQANDTKDKFFSIIGHDMRSPLVSLKGLLGMVIRNEISESEFKTFASKLHHLVIGTNETLENLLQWAHSQIDGWHYAPADLALKPLVLKCASLFYEAAMAKKIELIINVEEKEIVYVEANQIELIIRNLIHNAIKFTPNGGQVHVTSGESGESGEFVEVRVTDTGLGMLPEDALTIFQKHPTHTTRGTQGERGTGLGLLLCKEMIENNGGKIAVTSELGKGSTFHVFLKRSSAI